MPNKNFNNFSAKTDFSKNDQFVGFSAANSNGEKKWTYESLKTNFANPHGFRNLLINGNFDIWQRYPQGALNINWGGYVADRWISGHWNSLPGYAGNVSVERLILQDPVVYTDANVFDPNRPFFSGTSSALRYKYNVTKFSNEPLHTNLTSAEGYLAIQQIENIAPYLGKTMTVSFMARASKACKLLFETQIHTSEGGSFWTPTIHKLFDIQSTTSWDFYSFTFTMPTYMQVLASGYDPNAVDVAKPTYKSLHSQGKMPKVSTWLGQADFKVWWTKGSSIKHGNSSARPTDFPGQALTDAELKALCDSAEGMKNGQTLDITNIQFELGDSPTPFEVRHPALELQLCQRYYEKSYDLNQQPGTPVPVGVWPMHTWGHKNAGNTYDYRFYSPFKVTKRAVPTVKVYSPKTGAVGHLCYAWDGNTPLVDQILANNGAVYSSTQQFHTAHTTNTLYRNAYIEWTAECEL